LGSKNTYVLIIVWPGVIDRILRSQLGVAMCSKNTRCLTKSSCDSKNTKCLSKVVANQIVLYV